VRNLISYYASIVVLLEKNRKVNLKQILIQKLKINLKKNRKKNINTKENKEKPNNDEIENENKEGVIPSTSTKPVEENVEGGVVEEHEKKEKVSFLEKIFI